jgi:uncharacterized cupredoxin-like copper-binding protein
MVEIRKETAMQTTVDDQTEAVERSLLSIESEVRHQGRETKRIYTAFAIFAVLALVIALVNLIAVTTKLGTKDIRVTTVAAQPAAPAAPAAASPAALPHNVPVSLKEFTITPNATTAAAGKVTFNVKNDGTVTHEFVVLKTDKPAGSLLKGNKADETGNVGETGDLAVGASKSITLNLAAGHYALICNLPGHYKAGQHTDFTVK